MRALAKSASERASRVAALANRLRLIQIDFADESHDARMGYLSEEVQRALGEVPPQERQAFLEALRERFPTWDANVEVVAQAERPAAWDETSQRELNDPSFLVSRLAELVPQLSEAQRQALIEHLRGAGLAPQIQQHGWPQKPVQQARTALKLGRKSQLDAARLLELVAPLVSFIFKLDPLVRKQWAVLAPKSRMLASPPLQHALSRFVSGDAAVTRDAVEQEMDTIRNVLAGMVYALSRVGEFSTGYLAQFSPIKIQELAKFDRRWWISNDAKCWEKFKEVAQRALTETALETEFRDKTRSSIENLVQRTPRGDRGTTS